MRWFDASRFGSDELDNRLKELAITAQNHPPQSRDRRAALTKLHSIVVNSKKLWYPPSNRFNQYIYDEAKQELWCYVCQFIEKYDPQKGEVIAWIKTLLKTRFYPKAEIEYFKITSDQNICKEVSQPEENDPSLLSEVWDYIELDPDDIFQQECVKNHPEANFKVLIRYRRCQIMWKDISEQMMIKASTLINFYQRCIKKFAPIIKQYLSQ